MWDMVEAKSSSSDGNGSLYCSSINEEYRTGGASWMYNDRFYQYGKRKFSQGQRAAIYKKILSTDEIQDLRGSESADVLYLDKYKYLKYAIEKLAVQQLSFLIRIRIRITGSKG